MILVPGRAEARLGRSWLCVTLALWGSLGAARGRAADFVVDTQMDGVDLSPGDGQCATGGGTCTLRAAIQESNALPGLDRISLPAGRFLLTIPGSSEDLGASGDLDVRDDLAIEGSAVDATTIDAQELDRVLDVQGAVGRVITLRRLTLRNGRVGLPGRPYSGAGLSNGLGAQLNLEDVDIRDNVIQQFWGAAGIENAGCLRGTRVRILGNRDLEIQGTLMAAAGGVLTHGAGSCLELSDSELSGNLGDYAGAIYADEQAPVTLRRTLLAENQARFSGAMLLNADNLVQLENVTISNNRGNNAVLVDGGANLALVNCTVTGNRGPDQFMATVGGIHNVGGVAGPGGVVLTNTVLAGNGPAFLADDCRTVTSQGSNLVGHTAGCNLLGAQPTDQLDVDAQLSPLADHGGFTRTHGPGPLALERGLDAACPAMDQRGVARPQDADGDGIARCDVGAVELVDLIFRDGFE